MSDAIEIPCGWTRLKIGECAKVKRGASPRPIEDPKWWGGEIGWVRISDVTSSRKYLTRTRDYLSDDGVRNSVQIDVGEVVLSICATIGRPIITEVPVCIHDGFVWFDGLREDIDREYFYYYLASKEAELANSRQTGTQGNLNTTIVSKLDLLLPASKAEQTKIADILSAADDAIARTEALIAKQQLIKTGLIQDLLTRGIDEHGNLRSEQTHSFKDSPLGRIPVEWGSCPLGLLIDIKQGYAFSGEFFSDQRNDKVLLTPGNFHVAGGLYFNARNSKYYTGTIPPEFILTNGDVVVVMTDLTKEMAILGKTAMLDHPDTVLLNQRIGKVSVNRGIEMHLGFLTMLMNSDAFRKKIQATATGTTVRHSSPTKLMSPHVPRIALEEQVRIFARFDALGRDITDLCEDLNKKRLLKTGLMQDLLTGKKRVTPLLELEPAH